MCHYTHVGYACGHCRYTVREWCGRFETTHNKCPLHVVAIEKRTREICSTCVPYQEPEWMQRLKRREPETDIERRTQAMFARQSRQTMASAMGLQYPRPQPSQ